jgi:hypothetical protein
MLIQRTSHRYIDTMVWHWHWGTCRYQMKMTVLDARNIADQLRSFLDSHPNIKAVLLGIRIGDPSSGMQCNMHVTCLID